MHPMLSLLVVLLIYPKAMVVSSVDYFLQKSCDNRSTIAYPLNDCLVTFIKNHYFGMNAKYNAVISARKATLNLTIFSLTNMDSPCFGQIVKSFSVLKLGTTCTTPTDSIGEISGSYPTTLARGYRSVT